MTIRTYQIDERTLDINGKAVYKDQDGNWVSKIELTQTESCCLNDYIRNNDL